MDDNPYNLTIVTTDYISDSTYDIPTWLIEMYPSMKITKINKNEPMNFPEPNNISKDE